MTRNLLASFQLLFILTLSLIPHLSARTVSNTYEIKDLFNLGPDFFPTAEWAQTSPSSDKVFYCGPGSTIPYFGGPAIYPTAGSFVGKSYYPTFSHNVIYYSITFSLNNLWALTDGIQINFSDGINTYTVSWQPGAANDYGQCVHEVTVRGKVPHSGPIGLYIVKVGGTGSFGFRRIFLRLASEGTPSNSDGLCAVSRSLSPINNMCPCPKNQFLSIGACTDCHKSCEECFGPAATDCLACNFGYYYDGTQCQPCSSTCTDCDTCGICSENNFYMDHTCRAKCEIPFMAVESGDRKFCLSPCNDTEVVYADGTCNTTCIAPFVLSNTTDYTRQICQSPCPGQTLLYNGNCSSTGCPYPLIEKVYGGSMEVCQYPCNSLTEIYYPHNTTCMPACQFPYINKTYDSFSACESPCALGFHWYWNSSCEADCPSLLQPENINGVWVCHPPQCGVVFCSPCDVGNVCPEYYYCNTTFRAFCMPYNTYALEIEAIRPILNGMSLTVEVVPSNGIRAIDDILDVEIDGLHKNVDYSAQITKISKGFYQVEITIFTNVNNTTPIASFVYAPNTLGLNSIYTLPRLTFISTSVQLAAKDTDKGSQIGFLIFLVTIIGNILGGGLTSVWTAMPESQYSYYLLYLNIDFLHHTEVYFESLSNYDILVDSPDEGQEHLSLFYRNILPRKFYIRDYEPDFLENSDQMFLQALLSVLVLVVSTLLVKYVRFSGHGNRIMKLLNYVRKSLRWNLIIRQILTYSLPISIAGFIQIYTVIFSQKINLLSLLTCIVTLLAFLWCFKHMLLLIHNIPKTNREVIAISQRFGTLWEDLDTSLDSRYYYWLVAIRGFLLAYVAVFFSIFPYIQIIVLIVYQCYLVSLFIRKFRVRTVFREKVLNKVTFIEEICLLLLKVMILIYMIMLKLIGDKSLILMGWVMIVPAVVAQAVQIFYSIWSQTSQIDRLTKIYGMVKDGITGKKRLRKIIRIRSRLNNGKIGKIGKIVQS